MSESRFLSLGELGGTPDERVAEIPLGDLSSELEVGEDDDDDDFFAEYGVMWFNEDDVIDEAEYQGRKDNLGKPMAGDVKKFKVYVKDPKTGKEVDSLLYKGLVDHYNSESEAETAYRAVVDGPKFKTVQSIGKIEGKISNKKKGKNGFGYDPIFIPNGKKITFSQMKQTIKFKIDHRSKAFKKIKKFF